jgi:hypothetical protein
MAMKHLFTALLVAVATAGCTATLNGSVTPTPGASTDAGGGASTNTSTNTTVGATTTVNANASVNATLAALYKVGRKWEYETSSSNASVPAATYSEEVIELKNDGKTAVVKHVQAGTSTNFDVDLTAKDTQTAVMNASNASFEYKIDKTETVSATVKAGTFAGAVHVTGTSKAKASAEGMTANSETAFETWVKDDVGLLKTITTTKLDISGAPQMPQMPAGMQLPGGMTMPGVGAAGDIKVTVELVSFK